MSNYEFLVAELQFFNLYQLIDALSTGHETKRSFADVNRTSNSRT